MSAKTQTPVNVADTARAIKGVYEKALPVLSVAGCFAMAYFAAGAQVFGTLRPFGIALAACVNAPYAFAASAGAVIGYAVSMPYVADAVPYLCGVLAALLLRAAAVHSSQKFSPYAPAAAGAACCFAVSSAIAILSQSGAGDILYAAAQALLICGLAYLLHPAASDFAALLASARTDAESRASLMTALAVLVCALVPYHFGVFATAYFAAAACVLCGVYVLGEYGAALAGAAVCAALAASQPQMLFAGVGLLFAGAAAGFAAGETRLVTSLVMCAACAAALPLAPDAASAVTYMLSVCTGTLAAAFVPQKHFAVGGMAVYTPHRAGNVAAAARLGEMSDALSSIGTTLEAVCTRMPSREQSFSELCDSVSAQVCRGCARCGMCWGSGKNDVYDAFNKLQPLLVRGVVTPDDLPEPLHTSCLHPRRLAELFTLNWQRLLNKRKTIAAGKAMRGALSEQYAALAAALCGAARLSQLDEAPDNRRAQRVEKLFLSFSIRPLETHVSTDAVGRVHVMVRMPRTEFTRETLDAVAKEAGAQCRCALMRPVCTHTGLYTQLDFLQAPHLKTLYGVCSRPAVGDVSADAVKTFTDACGLAHVLICDGMGTGKAAAVDGALAAALCEKLLAAGFGAAETARLANVAMSFKGDCDAGAALDALTVNLFTGEASLFKAGGAVSFLLRHGVVTMLGGDSLPIGILGTVTGRTDSFSVQNGDLLVLVSDGAVCGDADWLLARLADIRQKAPQDIAGAIVAAAKARTPRPDDITAVCVKFAAQSA